MHKSLLILLLQGVALSLSSQDKFTEQLQQNVDGQGVVVLHQSPAITDLVNGGSVVATPTKVQGNQAAAAPSALTQAEDSTNVEVRTTGQRVRANGFRIQVYSGGNSRQSKAEAQRMGARVKSSFGGLNVYTHFVSPHWICRVGDFKTYEEANEVFLQLKNTAGFREATIVKSKVYVYY